jgi:hypothetical protein
MVLYRTIFRYFSGSEENGFCERLNRKILHLIFSKGELNVPIYLFEKIRYSAGLPLSALLSFTAHGTSFHDCRPCGASQDSITVSVVAEVSLFFSHCEVAVVELSDSFHKDQEIGP